MKYLVMETFDSYAVLLDEEGRFVKSANPGYEIGETIHNPVLMRAEPLENVQEKRRLPKKLVATVATIAALVALFFGVNFYQSNFVPYSSIFMAINPEVELVLNRKGEVLEVEGANEDGLALIEEYEPTSEDKVAVANELVDRAIEMGFLAEGGQISFAIDTPEQVLFEEYGIELREELDGRVSITIEITDADSSGESNESQEAPPEQTEEEPSSEEDEFISLQEAKQIVFDHAGVDGSHAEFDNEALDSDDGLVVYELEFEIGEDEYEYEIDARTGTILDYDIELEED